jgi:hypothetical protein
MRVDAISDRLRMWSVMNSGPVAQLSPIESRSAWATEESSASAFWPASMVPIGSMVPETMTGILRPVSRSSCWMPSSAALILRVSWLVSTRKISTPPSASALA